MKTQQRGGTVAGLLAGVVLGLGIALAVAAYINKVPVPFVSHASNSAAQDEAEARRNRDWNPNAALQDARPAGDSDQAGDPSAGQVAEVSAPDAESAAPASNAAPPAAPDPLDALIAARTPPPAAGTSVGAFQYFVQAGAFGSQGEADAQRARLAMLGWEARVSELEQNGSILYRVRVGPFGRRDDAEQLKQGLDSAGVVSTLVRAPRG